MCCMIFALLQKSLYNLTEDAEELVVNDEDAALIALSDDEADDLLREDGMLDGEWPSSLCSHRFEVLDIILTFHRVSIVSARVGYLANYLLILGQSWVLP